MIMNERGFKIVQRQGLGGVLGGVGNIVSDVGSGVSSAVAGVGAGVTSGLGDITSALLPSTTSDTATSTTLSSTSTSAASTHTSSSFITTSSSATSSSSSTSSTSSSSSTSAIPSTSTSVYTSTSGDETITAFVTSSPSSTPTSSNSSGFLNNKPLEGSVFALCGIVVLVIIFVIVTFALRRSRRKRMINEALSYEPTTMHGYTNDMERGSTEKIRNSYSTTRSSSGEPPAAGGYHNQQTAYGYDHEYPAYAPRSPNPIYDAGRAYVYEGGPYNSQGNNVGGPGLPRSFPPVAPQASLPTHVNPAGSNYP
ncbi:hypothetical protein BDP27DRAFT_1314848 [Rhodocollybia butyracea]|uniref:Uncharacterized protein n=1 Tax=Rhodocollybia butyracea TaxID=206335 RepID=A0A9P5Q7E8_9AGAR|nr:hypothetical protein BDP27DRAFT_1314848 [Rhodocollybia butyracea]